jgi:hypothetical protein
MIHTKHPYYTLFSRGEKVHYFRSNVFETGQIVYGEFDSGFYCLCVVYETGMNHIATNRLQRDGLLSEGSFASISDDLGEEISEFEFSAKWRQASYMVEWEAAKCAFSIGMQFEASVIIPRGSSLTVALCFMVLIVVTILKTIAKLRSAYLDWHEYQENYSDIPTDIAPFPIGGFGEGNTAVLDRTTGRVLLCSFTTAHRIFHLKPSRIVWKTYSDKCQRIT